MERRNNYLIQKEAAKKQFMDLDQQTIIDKWNLKNDEKWIYLLFFNKEYKIDRTDANVLRKELSNDGAEEVYVEAGFEEVLGIFDLLTYSNTLPVPAKVFAPVNSLRGGAKTIGVGTGELHSKYAEKINKEPEKFCKACENLGADKISIGDIGYEFTVFKDLNLRLKFYYADEDFDAQLVCLLDENTLSYIHYETAFYVMGYLFDSIVNQFPEIN